MSFGRQAHTEADKFCTQTVSDEGVLREQKLPKPTKDMLVLISLI